MCTTTCWSYKCAGAIQEICEPIFDSVKPPFMNKLGFRKLQFGDAPIRIEAVRMNRERKEGVFLEMDFRWAGDPDIQLFVDALGGCAPAMCAAWLQQCTIVRMYVSNWPGAHHLCPPVQAVRLAH